MSGFRSLSIQRKLTIITMLTTVVALVLASAAFFLFDILTLRQRMEADLEGLAQTMEANTTNALVFNDRQTAGQILSSLSVHEQVEAAAIFDRPGNRFAEYLRDGVTTDLSPTTPDPTDAGFHDDHLSLYHDIRFGDETVGTFYIRSDLSEINDRLVRYSGILAVVLVSVILISLILSSRLQRLISKPILDLVEVEKKVIEKQDYSVRAKKDSDDEIGLLIDAFNLMLAQIESRDEEITIARDRAEEASRSKSTFLANMSHELRTPLNAIIGYSEMLEEDAEDLGQDDFVPDLQKIRSAGKHLLSLINGVLDLSKIEAGKMELYLEDFPVADLMEEVRATAVPLVEKNGNVFNAKVDGGPAALGLMRADLTKTRQILLNLLSNAAKFTKSGEVRMEVARRTAGGSDWLRFRVVDTGIGMTPDQLAKVFEPFSQADVSTTRKYGGTGLGLSICKRFCEMMGGDIYVDSRPGEGTTFTVQLPAEVLDEADSGVRRRREAVTRDMLDSREIPAAALQQQLAGGDGGERRVLIIDDDPTVHDLLKGILLKEGFQVSSALDAHEGLRLARELKPTLITLDVRMPERDGWHVLADLKSESDLAEIPVIMVSVIEDRKTAFALGAADYLTKPIERDRLTALLAKYGSGGASPATALVVDDDVGARERMTAMLERQGWQVVQAANGVEALRRVADRRPQLILLDLIMPELDGFGFLTELRKTQAWRTIPVVVITAMDLTPEDTARLNGGVDKVLQKGSFDLDRFKAEIRSLAQANMKRG
jgi:signal transduction histidine kinase/DNA-binding response OmpR family regulator